MKERVADEELIIISVAVRGINDHIRFTVKCFLQLPSTPLTRQEHRTVPPNANPVVWILIRVVSSTQTHTDYATSIAIDSIWHYRGMT